LVNIRHAPSLTPRPLSVVRGIVSQLLPTRDRRGAAGLVNPPRSYVRGLNFTTNRPRTTRKKRFVANYRRPTRSSKPPNCPACSQFPRNVSPEIRLGRDESAERLYFRPDVASYFHSQFVRRFFVYTRTRKTSVMTFCYAYYFRRQFGARDRLSRRNVNERILLLSSVTTGHLYSRCSFRIYFSYIGTRVCCVYIYIYGRWRSPVASTYHNCLHSAPSFRTIITDTRETSYSSGHATRIKKKLHAIFIIPLPYQK